ncbi:MAG: heme-binding protein [Myxococcales bacterium]|nr:heme-binding protein [Myxococcales bacterium]
MIAPRTLAFAAVGALVSLAVVRWQAAGRFVEEPDFTVERDDGAIEIRRYAPVVRAETTVENSDRNIAVNEGFRRLAGYIFGANHGRNTIAMTAPVTQSQRGERIAMTAPVTPSGDGGSWLVTFTMPRGSAVESMPVPNDARVTLRAIPARRVAVLRYSGSSSPEVLAAHERTLRAWLTRNGLSASGPATSARYDPPSTLPLLRRNELWLELDAA